MILWLEPVLLKEDIFLLELRVALAEHDDSLDQADGAQRHADEERQHEHERGAEAHSEDDQTCTRPIPSCQFPADLLHAEKMSELIKGDLTSESALGSAMEVRSPHLAKSSPIHRRENRYVGNDCVDALKVMILTIALAIDIQSNSGCQVSTQT